MRDDVSTSNTMQRLGFFLFLETVSRNTNLSFHCSFSLKVSIYIYIVLQGAHDGSRMGIPTKYFYERYKDE